MKSYYYVVIYRTTNKMYQEKLAYNYQNAIKWIEFCIVNNYTLLKFYRIRKENLKYEEENY